VLARATRSPGRRARAVGDGDLHEELQSLVLCLGTGLSSLEADALRLYLEGSSYEDMAERLECDTKTIDNALQRVKRKIITHQKAREVTL